jgi:hypothetical protein
MPKRKMKSGICRVCGLNKELSYEHIPPRSAFNKNTKFYSVPFAELKDVKNPLDFKPKGKIFQGGIGVYSLCRECNSFLGRNYVKAYERWAFLGSEILSEITQEFYLCTLMNIEPLKILKQIISMSLSLNDDWYLEEYPELSQFVKDTASKNLPARYQVFVYLNNEGHYRYSKHSFIHTSYVIINATEITFPPFGYLLTVDGDDSMEGFTNITDFKNFPMDKAVDVNILLFRKPTISIFPLDYRTKEQFE